MRKIISPKPSRKKVAFVLFPGFASTSFSLSIEALSVANKISNNDIYDYQLYSSERDVKNVSSSNKVPVSTHQNFLECHAADIIFICAYEFAAQYSNDAVESHLRFFYNKGSQLVSLSNGSFILAKAGLLNNKSCTLFHEHINTFKEIYPDITVHESIFTVDGSILTCAGGLSSLDLMLYIIKGSLGQEFAQHVSGVFLQDRIRTYEESQNFNRINALRAQSPLLAAAIEIMELNIENPLKISVISEKIGTNQRTLEKKFRSLTKYSPTNYYRTLRLQHAKSLVENTNLSISVIAQATGFTSQSYFSKCFKEHFFIQPIKLR